MQSHPNHCVSCFIKILWFFFLFQFSPCSRLYLRLYHRRLYRRLYPRVLKLEFKSRSLAGSIYIKFWQLLIWISRFTRLPKSRSRFRSFLPLQNSRHLSNQVFLQITKLKTAQCLTAELTGFVWAVPELAPQAAAQIRIFEYALCNSLTFDSMKGGPWYSLTVRLEARGAWEADMWHGTIRSAVPPCQHGPAQRTMS